MEYPKSIIWHIFLNKAANTSEPVTKGSRLGYLLEELQRDLDCRESFGLESFKGLLTKYDQILDPKSEREGMLWSDEEKEILVEISENRISNFHQFFQAYLNCPIEVWTMDPEEEFSEESGRNRSFAPIQKPNSFFLINNEMAIVPKIDRYISVVRFLLREKMITWAEYPSLPDLHLFKPTVSGQSK